MPSRKIEDLIPVVADKCRALINLCKDKGHDILITCTLRTEAEQLALFAQGRKNLLEVNGLRKQAGMPDISEKENRIVTKVLTSIHQFGCAFDFVILKDGKPFWNTEADTDADGILDYDEVGLLGEYLGLKWGGRFGDKKETQKIEGWDKAHFEYTGGLSLADLKAGGNKAK